MNPATPRQSVARSYATQYGTITIAARGFRRSNGTTRQRYDDYTAKSDGTTTHETVMVVDANDYSEQHSGPYDFECSCCFLGFNHSVSAHQARQ